MDWMTFKILNNEVKSWLISFCVLVIAYAAISLIKKILSSKIEIISKATTTKVDDLIFNLLNSTKPFFIFFWSFYLALSLLSLPAAARTSANNIIFIVCMFQAAAWANAAVKFWVEHCMTKRVAEDATSATTIGLVVLVAKASIYALLLLLTLNNLGINITALVTGLGVGGIAVALAVQNILSDLFASLTIVLDKPFVVGDFITVGEHSGTVEKVGLKTTRIRSLSGEQLIFPNASLLQSQVKNFQRMVERRVVFVFGVIYETPTGKLKKVAGIIEEIIRKNTNVRFDRAHFKSFGDFSLNFEAVYWVESADYSVYMDVQQKINFELLERLGQEGIEFAYPTQTLYGKNLTTIIDHKLSQSSVTNLTE